VSAPKNDNGGEGLRPELKGRESVVSKLSLEYGSAEEEGESVADECRNCKGTEFRVRMRGLGGNEERFLVCVRCGTAVS
jgi:hypothetical protein